MGSWLPLVALLLGVLAIVIVLMVRAARRDDTSDRAVHLGGYDDVAPQVDVEAVALRQRTGHGVGPVVGGTGGGSAAGGGGD